MLAIVCDWCGQPENEVFYSIVSASAIDVRPLHFTGTDHLHFKCLPQWVAYMHGGPEPTWNKKESTKHV